MPQLPGALPIVPRADELSLLEHMFKNEKINHRLHSIIKAWQIARVVAPEGFGDTPCIRFRFIASRSAEFNIPSDLDGSLVDKWEKMVQIDIVVQHHAEMKYNQKFYKGIEQTLPLVASLVTRIISENLEYETDDIPGVCIDDMDISNFYYDVEYEGDPDFAVASFVIDMFSENER